MSKKKEQTEGPEAPQTNNVFSKPAVGQAARFTPFITLRNPLPYMDKVEKILEKYKTYIGVRYVKVVARPYKTRDAFTDLSSSPPTIYLNEHLIDDEEVVEYLIIRELIHIKLHRYPQPRYGVSTLTYTDKFYNTLYFLMPKEKVEEIRERIVKKLIEVNRRPR
jgi:Zn-dependent peptidase ImmA (M78 family)